MIRNFTFHEFVKSQTAIDKEIDNIPRSFSIIENLLFTAKKMQDIRDLLGVPIRVTSGYRSRSLNQAVKGSSGSQHLLGQAVDFIAPDFGNPYDVCKKITSSGILFDQLILEPSWVHVSFRREYMRNHFLVAKTN